MMNRRQFVPQRASAAMLLTAERVRAELRIDHQGGRVIDPSIGIDAVRDVRLPAAGSSRSRPTSRRLPAARSRRRKIVSPGLIDIQLTPAFQGSPRCAGGRRDVGRCRLRRCGQHGSGRSCLPEAPQIGRALINIARTGVARGECMISTARRRPRRGAIARNRDIVIASRRGCRTTWVAPTIRGAGRAQAAAGDLPVMIHVGQNTSPLRSLLALLKRRYVTHIYAPAERPPRRQGQLIRRCCRRRRGIHLTSNASTATSTGRRSKPRRSRISGPTRSPPTGAWVAHTGVVDMPNVMSKLIMFGMPISAVIAANLQCRRIFPSFDNRGTLNVGAPAM